MKKWQILIPSVMVAATPLTALTACNKDEAVKFSMTKDITASSTFVSVDLTWTPKHNLLFPGFAIFSWNSGQTIYPYIEEPSKAGATHVSFTFDSVPSEDIIDGVLEFTYNDTTIKRKGIEKTITGISIHFER